MTTETHPERAAEIDEAQIKSILDLYVPKKFLDDISLEYLTCYFTEADEETARNLLNREAIADFVEPLVEPNDRIDQLVEALFSFCAKKFKSLNSAEDSISNIKRKLDAPVVMADMTSEVLALSNTNDLGDVSHVKSHRRPKVSNVDEAKLREQEKQRERKLERRKEKDVEQPAKTWQKNPSLIVNQVNVKVSTDSKNKDVFFENFDISYGGKPILQNAKLQLVAGRRYGLVGKNGIGKSTLLRALGTRELRVPSHIRILHVEQEISGDDTQAIQSVLAADTERAALIQEEQRLEQRLPKFPETSEEYSKCAARLEEIYKKLEELDSDQAEPRAYAILAGLGFSSEQMQAATRTFSGGWRMRLALARALFCMPDLLLADEVTNYLDFPAVVWLERYFQKWPATLLIVSHDRSFLDAVATDVLHMHDGQMDAYKGNFSMFVSTRIERRKALIRDYEAQLQYRQHLQQFIDKWRYNAKRASLAQSKIKILEKLGPLEPPPMDEMEGLGGEDGSTKSVYFKFPDPENLSPPILQMEGVTFGYNPEKPIVSRISLDVIMESKTAVVGPNGAGKSTLVKLLMGEISPQSGLINRHGRLRIALFSQHHVDQLDLSKSGVEFLQSLFPGKTSEEYRRFLGRYGITGMTALQPIGTLSGGQKSRIVFAWMAMSNPHVLILDEPTNHLDMDSIDALSSGLRAFAGGILIVSHDENFLDAVCNDVWVLDNKSLSKFEGAVGNPDGVVKQYKASLKIED